jgi:hypothetical protein
LATSSAITGTPYFHPSTRQTFVAPMLFDPTRRMSMRLTSRTSQ